MFSNFLNPLYLLAIPVVAVPILLHLLQRRQRQVVAWGAMQFLTDAVGEGRRFDRLEEWLLLAFRTLALLVFVLALARPFMPNWFGQESGMGQEVVMIIDDSLSADRTIAGVRVMDNIRSQANEFIDNCPTGCSVRVMLASAGPRWLVDKPVLATSAGKKQLKEELGKVNPTRGTAKMLSCLRLATTLDSDNDDAPRQVIVFTDGLAHGWNAEVENVWASLRRAIDKGSRQIQMSVVALESKSIVGANLSVDDIETTRKTIGMDESVAFRAKVSYTGPDNSLPTSLEWKVADKPVGKTDVPPIAPGQTVTLDAWRHSFSKMGIHDVTAELALRDALPLDNDSGVVMNVVDEIPIAVLTPRLDREDADNNFLATALGHDQRVGPNEEPGWKSLYRPTFIDFASANSESLGGYDAVVVSSLGQLAPEVVEKLHAFVNQGGGLWVMLGPRLDRSDFNRHWYRDGTGLCPLQLAGLKHPELRDSDEAMIHPPDKEDHPATVMLADTTRLDIDQVRLHRYHTFRRQPGQEVTMLLRTGRFDPLAVLGNVGKGRVIVQAFPLRTDWTDLAISKSFVVMLHDWLGYLSERSSTQFNLVSRATFAMPLADPLHHATASVTLPSGDKVETKPVGRDGVVSYRFGQTSLPGKYSLSWKSEDKTREVAFRVRRDAEESNLAPMTSDQKSLLENAAGIQFGPVEQAFAAAEAAPIPREPAWWLLLIAMVCLMAAESLLATRVSTGRFGSAAATT